MARKPRVVDHREASRTEGSCFARLIIGHNDAVLCALSCACVLVGGRSAAMIGYVRCALCAPERLQLMLTNA